MIPNWSHEFDRTWWSISLGTFICLFITLVIIYVEFTMITKFIHHFTSYFSGAARRRIIVAFRFFFFLLSIHVILGPFLSDILGDIYPKGRLKTNSQIASNAFYLVTFSQKALLWKLLCETANPVMSPRGHLPLKKRLVSLSLTLLHLCCA